MTRVTNTIAGVEVSDCDETCVAFVRCIVCHALTRNYTSTSDYPTGPRCVEYFACARRKDERDAAIK